MTNEVILTGLNPDGKSHDTMEMEEAEPRVSKDRRLTGRPGGIARAW